MWYVGIDWADEHHDAVVLDETGKRVAATQVAHSAEGLERLVAFLQGIGDVRDTPDHLACSIEPSQGLLISRLLEAGLPVYPVNPKTVDRQRSAAGAKTDVLDAYLLARKGRSDLADLRRLQPDSPIIAELKVLTRDQDSLIASQTRLVNQLTACLKSYYPIAVHLFGKLAQATTLAFLQAYPTLAAARAASVTEISGVLQAAGHPHAVSKAQAIVAALQQPQLEADPGLSRAKSRLALTLVAQLQALLPALAAYDTEITRLFLTHADSAVFASLPRAAWRRGCWRNGAMTGGAIRTRPASKPSPVLRRCPGPAASSAPCAEPGSGDDSTYRHHNIATRICVTRWAAQLIRAGNHLCRAVLETAGNGKALHRALGTHMPGRNVSVPARLLSPERCCSEPTTVQRHLVWTVCPRI